MENTAVSKTAYFGSYPNAPARKKKMTKEAFAQFIKEYRIKRNKSLYEVAQLCHTGSGTISRWENGHTAPPEAARIAIVKRLEEIK